MKNGKANELTYRTGLAWSILSIRSPLVASINIALTLILCLLT